MRRKGFTLVELLVVVAIIALLISILAPTLKSAKDLAKQMICATHLRAIGTGSTLYAEANRGQFPSYRWGKNVVDGIILSVANLARAYEWNDATEQPFLLADGSGRNTPIGIGFLHFAGLVAPDMLYCPLQASVNPAPNRFTRATYADPYGLKKLPWAEAGSVVFHSGYEYNLNCTVLSGNQNAIYTYSKAEQMPSRAFMAMDLMLTKGWLCHLLAGPDTPSWQVANSGGSVTLKQSAKVYQLMTDLNGGWYGGVGDTDSWPSHVQAMGYIQGTP